MINGHMYMYTFNSLTYLESVTTVFFLFLFFLIGDQKFLVGKISQKLNKPSMLLSKHTFVTEMFVVGKNDQSPTIH